MAQAEHPAHFDRPVQLGALHFSRHQEGIALPMSCLPSPQGAARAWLREWADLSLRCRAKWALPDLPAPAAIATEGRGRQVMYQADFWIAWGLFLSESPNEFADHKENAVCLITELQSVPSLPPRLYSSPGIYCSFSI